MPTKKLNSVPLKQKAKDNTTITRRVAGEEPVVVKAGVPNDHPNKRKPYEGMSFGISKGVTKNMGDYESLRVDVWLNDVVQPGETVEEAFARVEAVVDETLEQAVISSVGE